MSSSSIGMATGAAVCTIKPSATSTQVVHLPDLPSDVLGTVFSRLTGLGRIRFAATSRSWRAAAITWQHLAPPSLPWFFYHNYKAQRSELYCPEYGSNLSMPLLIERVHMKIVGFHDGGWVALLGNDLQHVIVNLYSKIKVALSTRQRAMTFCGHLHGPYDIRKIIFSESPTSPGCILAAITHSSGLALSGVGYPDYGWMTKDGVFPVDIAFCNGQLYGLMAHEEIVMFEIGVNEYGTQVISCDAHPLPVLRRGAPSLYPGYIIEFHGKLALAVRNRYNHELTFKVYELSEEGMTPGIYKWEEATSLAEYALFFGRKWSKTVYVPPGGRGLVQRNYIYTDGVVYKMIPDSVYHIHERGDGLQMINSAESNATSGPQVGMWLPPPHF